MVIASRTARRSLWVAVAFFSAFFLYSARVSAQSLTTGAIAGTVTDQTAAVVPGATVTVTSIGTGATRTLTTNAAGSYLITLLVPADYRIKVGAKGFKTAEQGPITVTVSQTATVSITLEVGTATQTVEVTANAQLITTENPNNTATVGQMAIANLPNPGMDLTFAAQVAPGAMMNTSGGYGNVEFNGLPAESTNFTIDGLDANDPFLNLNNSGATNLQLGLNSIQETSVNTLSFSVDEGRQGAAQINYVSKSGGNRFHGNAYEIWNGSSMNAANYFLNAQWGTNPKPFSNLNQFGGSVGGPILKDKLFFFFDWEQTRIVLPVSATDVITPTSAFETKALNALATGVTYPAGPGYAANPAYYDPVNGTQFGPMPNTAPALAYYNKMFGVYGSHSGSPYVVDHCWFNADGSAPTALTNPGLVNATWGNGCANKSGFGVGNFTTDRLWTARIDQHIGANNQLWYKVSGEAGVQATGSDPLNAAFNPYSTQPQYTGAMGWTHTFSPNLVNEFNPGFFWYSAIFGPNITKALAVSPFEYDGPFTSVWSTGAGAYPQGRRVTNWQLVDNLTWSRGKHQLKFGENFRRTLMSDYDPSAGSVPVISPGDIYEWAFGIADSGTQSFPLNGDQPIAVSNLDMYVGDTWKAKSNLTISYGLRATWDSNMISKHNAYSRMTGSFYGISHDVNQPLNAVVKTGLSTLLPSTQTIVWQPRAAIAWEVRPKTVVRIGGGKFSDLFPYVLADMGLTNFPNVNSFGSGNLGSVPGLFAVPGSGNGVSGDWNNDVVTAMQQANQAVVSGFAKGATSCYAASPTTPCLSRSNFVAFPDKFMPYPSFFEWSAGIEHQFVNNWSIKVQYVGTHATQLAYNYRPNARELYCKGCFTPYTGTRMDNRFATITQWQSGANSSYNALQTTIQKRLSHGLQFAFNHSWSHCLDTVSNGGRFAFGVNGVTNWIHPVPGQLYRMYGNCDFDVRQDVNGSYVYQLPTFTHSRLLGQVVNGWQVSGDVFLHTGYPFTALGSGNSHFSGTNNPYYATAIPGQPLYSSTKVIPGVTVSAGEIQWLNPLAFTSVTNVDTGGSCVGGNNPVNCQYGNAGRNTLRAPGFKWSDFFLTKRFKIRENVALRVEAQFYNVFNHPNFAYPGATYGVPGVADTLVDRGVITGTTQPPTGLLGSGLGGDTSVRMIALSARVEF